ncbi:MAG TPA: VIT domain-containing protein [Polyangiaceae bacterium]|nr:VIT domain-containing protein [Polyangiaceae bacterium]
MASTNQSERCAEVLEHLGEVLDGTASTELQGHVAECDRCRDVRHEAEEARRLAALAGLDHRPVADLEARVLAALDARDDAKPTPDTVKSPATAKSEAKGGQKAAEERERKTAKAPARSGTSPRVAVLVTGFALAAAAAVVVLRQGPGTDAAGGWSGTIERVASAQGKGGVLVCDASGKKCDAGAAGALIERGGRVKTDASTRVAVKLSDGSVVTLDRSTELLLLGGDARGARLSYGGLVADVTHQKSQARFELPVGGVTVHGTKFALRTQGKSASVDVTRGSVTLADGRERSVRVSEGESGRLEPDVEPFVEYSSALADSLGWSDEAFGEERATIAGRGLGELKARKPGQTEERANAVVLASHDVRVRISGVVARTEIEEVFENHSDDVLEGIYRFPLPPDAQIERLALDVDGKLENGSFVDRDRAAAIFRGAIFNAAPKQPKPVEEIVWVPGPWRDPALLEWQRGGRFELRVFPIPKRGQRRVVLAYTEVVKPAGGARRYTYPLAADPSGAARIGHFSLDLEVRGHDPSFGVRPMGYALERRQSAPDTTALRVGATSFAPTGDLSVEYALPGSARELTAWTYLEPRSDAPSAGAVASPGGVDDGAPYVALALHPKLPRPERESGRGVAIVVDTSRSMLGASYARASALAVRLAGELDEADRLTVLACGVDCEVLGSGSGLAPGPAAAAQVRTFLARITPEDASDVVGSVERALGELRGALGTTRRVIYLGDGAATVGQVKPGSIERAVGRAVLRIPAALVAVAVGSESDPATLDALARGGDGVMLPYSPGRSISEMTYAVLGASYGNALANVSVTLPEGLSAVAPARLSSIPAGGEAYVLARMNNAETAGDVVLRGRVGGKPFEQRYPVALKASTAAGNAFVPRLYAAARLADLEREGTDAAKTEAIALSTRFSVASRYTSLLVLESPAMFRAFGLEKATSAGSFTGDEAAESTSAEGAEKVDGTDDEAAEGRAATQNKPEESSRFSSLGSGASAAGALGGLADTAQSTEAAPKKKSASRAEPNFAPGPPVPTAAPAPAAKPAPVSPRAMGNTGADVLELEQQRDEFRERPRRMIPMRRIWERAGEIFPLSGPLPKNLALDELKVRVQSEYDRNPNRRDALKQLFVALLRAGLVDQAAPLAERWAEKEPLDAEALTARADVLAARGERAQAIRVLGSVLDAKPGDIASAKRLARLERWSGRPGLGCRFSVAIAEQRGSDAALLADAVRCARETLDGAVASELIESAAPATRAAAEKLLAGPRPDDQELRGDVRLEAHWQGDADLDLALVDPDGHRVSWLGAPTRGIITARSATSEHEEALALTGAKAGDYAIELVRSSGTAPSSGEVTVSIAGTTRRLPFTIDGPRVRIGYARISLHPRLVPL